MKAVLSAFIISVATCATSFAATPAELANEAFNAKREASATHKAISDKCAKVRLAIDTELVGKSPEERQAFFNDFNYQMRQNMAKLGKDEFF